MRLSMLMTLSISGILVCSPGLRHHAHGLPQAHDQRLTGLVDREQRAIGDDQRHDDDGGDNAANEIESHRAAPVCGGAGGCGRRESWSSGR